MFYINCYKEVNSAMPEIKQASKACSGFVDFNASNGVYILGQGYGTYGQHPNCRNISWSEVLPGDIVFYPGDSYVGIVCGFDEHGNVLIILCFLCNGPP